MTIRDEFGRRRAQDFALEQLITIHTIGGDLRWALAVLAARSVAALWGFGQARLALLVRHAARRTRQRVRFLTHIAPADTMVAAGGR
jgi:hypothetical protein